MNDQSFHRKDFIIEVFDQFIVEHGNNPSEWYLGYSRILYPEKFIKESHNITIEPLIIRSTIYPEDARMIIRHFINIKHPKIRIISNNRINHLYIYKISDNTIQNL